MMFLEHEMILSSNVRLNVVDFNFLSNQLVCEIDKFIVIICEGYSGNDIGAVKKRLLKFLNTKDDKTRCGAIAEFFIHIYLNIKGFKQEFLFFNLEEGSIKKGFDGIFSSNNQSYILESKSGFSSTKGISHKVKLLEAYNDINDYVTGNQTKSNNNPWRNAYNHASHGDVRAGDDIKKKMKVLANLYDNGEFSKIEDYSVIPCSTIFVVEPCGSEFSSYIKAENDFIKDFKARDVRAICITKKTMDLFLNYLSGN